VARPLPLQRVGRSEAVHELGRASPPDGGIVLGQ
jgi:hypothetical protein